MKFVLLFFSGFLLLAVSSGPGFAFDNQHPGFMMGLSLGYGSGEAAWDIADASITDSGVGVATGLRLGGCWSDRLWLYAVNRALFFEGDTPDNLVQGLAGLGGAWFFEPRGVDLFVEGEIGVAVRRNEELFHNEEGFGFAFGAGWVFREHWILEGNYLRATVEDGGPQRTLTNLTLGVGWLGF